MFGLGILEMIILLAIVAAGLLGMGVLFFVVRAATKR